MFTIYVYELVEMQLLYKAYALMSFERRNSILTFTMIYSSFCLTYYIVRYRKLLSIKNKNVFNIPSKQNFCI